MRKIWEGLALVVILSIGLGILSDAIQPFLPLIGIAIGIMLVLAVGVILFRLLFPSRKFW